VSDHACLSVQHVQPPIGHLCHCIIALFQAVSQQKPLKHLYIRAFRLYANGMHGILPGSAHTHSRLQAWQDNQLLSSHYSCLVVTTAADSRKVQSAPTTYQVCTNGRGDTSSRSWKHSLPCQWPHNSTGLPTVSRHELWQLSVCVSVEGAHL